MTVGNGPFRENGDGPVVRQGFLQRIDLFRHTHAMFAFDENRTVQAAQPADDGNLAQLVLRNESSAAGSCHGEDVDPRHVVCDKEDIAAKGGADHFDPGSDDPRRVAQEKHREGRTVSKNAEGIV